MALSDVLFTGGDNQNFIIEVPVTTLHAPLDIVFNATLTDFVMERPAGTVHAPLDWLSGNNTKNDVMVYPLVLTGGGGTRGFAFVA